MILKPSKDETLCRILQVILVVYWVNNVIEGLLQQLSKWKQQSLKFNRPQVTYQLVIYTEEMCAAAAVIKVI